MTKLIMEGINYEGNIYNPIQELASRAVEFDKFWKGRELPESPETTPDVIHMKPEILGRIGEAIELSRQDDYEWYGTNLYNRKTGKSKIGNVHRGNKNDTGWLGVFREIHNVSKTCLIPDLTIIDYHTHDNEFFASTGDILNIFNALSISSPISLIGTKNDIIYGLFPTQKAHKLNDEQERLFDFLRKDYYGHRRTTDEERIEWSRQLGIAPYKGVFASYEQIQRGIGMYELRKRRPESGIYMEKMKPRDKI